jgi:hypothetical protein
MYDFILNNKDVLDIVIQFFVAVGTIGAVWLATTQGKLKLSIDFSISIVADEGNKGLYIVTSKRFSGKRFVVFTIRNKGTRPVILQGASFYYNFKREDKAFEMITPFDMKLYSYPRIAGWGEAVPVILQPYEELIKYIAFDEENYRNVHKFRAYFIAGTGERIYAKIHKETRDMIIKDVEAYIKKVSSRTIK